MSRMMMKMTLQIDTPTLCDFFAPPIYSQIPYIKGNETSNFGREFCLLKYAGFFFSISRIKEDLQTTTHEIFSFSLDFYYFSKYTVRFFFQYHQKKREQDFKIQILKINKKPTKCIILALPNSQNCISQDIKFTILIECFLVNITLNSDVQE